MKTPSRIHSETRKDRTTGSPGKEQSQTAAADREQQEQKPESREIKRSWKGARFYLFLEPPI